MDKIEQLFRSNYAILYRTAFSILRDEEESKDIVSGVFAKLCEDRYPLPATRATKGFLMVCVRNACIDVINQKQMRERVMRLYPLDDDPNTTLPDAHEERLQQILDFIDKELNPRTSHIIKLCFSSGMSYKQASDIVGISVSGINKHIIMALQAMRQKFGKKIKDE